MEHGFKSSSQGSFFKKSFFGLMHLKHMIFVKQSLGIFFLLHSDDNNGLNPG